MDKPFGISWGTGQPDVSLVFIGATIPHALAERLALYALYRASSKSETINELLSNGLNDIAPTHDIMLEVLVLRANLEWEQRLKSNIGKRRWENGDDIAQRFAEYLADITDQLERRKIVKADINAIVESVKECGEQLNQNL